MKPDKHDIDQANDYLDALGHLQFLGQDRLPRSEQAALLAEHVRYIRAVKQQAKTIATVTGSVGATAIIEVAGPGGVDTTYRSTWTREGVDTPTE